MPSISTARKTDHSRGRIPPQDVWPPLKNKNLKIKGVPDFPLQVDLRFLWSTLSTHRELKLVYFHQMTSGFVLLSRIVSLLRLVDGKYSPGPRRCGEIFSLPLRHATVPRFAPLTTCADEMESIQGLCSLRVRQCWRVLSLAAVPQDSISVPPATSTPDGQPSRVVGLLVRRSKAEQSDRTRSWAVVEIVFAMHMHAWMV